VNVWSTQLTATAYASSNQSTYYQWFLLHILLQNISDITMATTSLAVWPNLTGASSVQPQAVVHKQL